MGSSQLQKRGKMEKKGLDAEKVVVAIKASKEIPKAALVWALTHVVQPGVCITLLVVVPPQNSGRKLWGFPRFAGDCANGHRKSHIGTTLEQKSDITDSCSQMMLRLHGIYDSNKINIKIRIVSGSPCGAVAAESKRIHANWVVLDKQLKQEEKCCMEELQCNIVVMKRSQPKVLRLNLVGSPQAGISEPDHMLDESEKKLENSMKAKEPLISIRGPTATPTSSPELETSFTTTEAGSSSVSSSEPATSPFFISETNLCYKKPAQIRAKEVQNVTSSDSDSESSSPRIESQHWKASIAAGGRSSSKENLEVSETLGTELLISKAKTLLEKFSKFNKEDKLGYPSCRSDLSFGRNVREAISFSRNAPPGPPPLCSICQHKAPVFGKPPRWFTYAELEQATDGFSEANFLAEGGFGSVHRGILPDGQAVAVKQHKLASSQGDQEFCSEVEVLSCAQHRNVVMLIGFCIENRRRLLVYEYICSGSLDSHLYGRSREPLEWSARQKIAVGAARGLRYLHEECRVGCIVHRDMRPNNILLTHDFESLVGDFGLARWQPDGDLGVETRVIGTFGYLAPEYAQSGQITEKADVYSFGVVLVELVTGRKAVDINRPKGQQFLTEWARPLLEEFAMEQLMDPRLGNRYSEHEVCCMLYAASLCIRRDPHTRPRMSQVLRILEGDILTESGSLSAFRHDSGSRSARIWVDEQHSKQHKGPVFQEACEVFGGKKLLGGVRSSLGKREDGKNRCLT